MTHMKSTKTKGSIATARKIQKNSLISKEREDAWYIPPALDIPVYNAESDKFCPRARMKKFNDDKKLEAINQAKRGQGASDWINKTLQSKFEDVPLKLKPSLRAKAMSLHGPREALAEVEILQKVVVRENFVAELMKLLDNQNDIGSCINEVVELVKAIRFQTLDIIEDIDAWQTAQSVPRSFLYRGLNYLIKISSDLNFLDQYDEIVERFCFELRNNPLAYRGGGDVIIGYSIKPLYNSEDSVKTYYDSCQLIDGIEVYRLRNAEKVIQKEYDRLSQEQSVFGTSSSSSHNQHKDSSTSLPPQDTETIRVSVSADGTNTHDSFSRNGGNREVGGTNRSRIVDKEAKPVATISSRKYKRERVAVLSEEADALRAAETHIDDKISTLVEQHRGLVEKRKVADGRRKEAVALDRQLVAQHIAVEISVMTADMQSLNLEIKDLQRESYFISLERQRKRKLALKLADELDAEKRRKDLEKKVAAQIKRGGLMVAIKEMSRGATMSHMSTPGPTQGKAAGDSDDDTDSAEPTDSRACAHMSVPKKQAKGSSKLKKREEYDYEVDDSMETHRGPSYVSISSGGKAISLVEKKLTGSLSVAKDCNAAFDDGVDLADGECESGFDATGKTEVQALPSPAVGTGSVVAKMLRDSRDV